MQNEVCNFYEYPFYWGEPTNKTAFDAVFRIHGGRAKFMGIWRGLDWIDYILNLDLVFKYTVVEVI